MSFPDFHEKLGLKTQAAISGIIHPVTPFSDKSQDRAILRDERRVKAFRGGDNDTIVEIRMSFKLVYFTDCTYPLRGTS